jgi:4-hydroxy-tetrahydrodipicolinate reductase
MVNGLPGKMGQIVAKTALERGLVLVPFSLTGEDVSAETTQVGSQTIDLLKPSNREAAIAKILADHPGVIAIDYTHPSAVNSNAEFYVRHRIPFVMGTTGGDRKALMDLVSTASLHCVIAPNMAKQIVAFQAMMEFLGTNFPGVFSGYKLSVVESHQKTKADTSGTAKAVVATFREMGLPFDDSQIEMVREEKQQLERMSVPAEALDGHAFHTYAVDSADGSVHFEFQHNVCGRRVYAEGTIDAAVYLAKTIFKGAEPRCHSMIDILRTGAMN